MGIDTTTNHGAIERCRALAMIETCRVGALRGLFLVLTFCFWTLAVRAQPIGDTEPAANPQLAAQPTAPSPSAEDAKALSARVEALEKLASGALPNIPLDSLLNVSLDDDSTMLERDAEARLERRRLMIALNQAERSQNKSEAELQQLRDQILALELERKVLALPIEVRERLVEENYKGSAAPAAVQPSPAPGPAPATPEANKPLPTGDAAAPSAAAAAVPRRAGARNGDHWFSGWVLFGALLLATFVLARLVGVAICASNRGLTGPDPEREQLAAFTQLGICAAGIIAAVFLSFSLPLEISTLMLGALVLLAVLAFKDVAASVLGGLTLFVQRPFRIGHRVEVGGIEGRVTDMGLLSVKVLGPQQRSINIPNSEFLTKLVSASPPSGVLAPIQVDFYIHPNDDIARAKAIITEVIQSTRGADASKARSGIVVTQIPLNGTVMVRLRAKLFVTGTHPEQEIASELSERVIERLRGGAPDASAESEHPTAAYPAAGAQASAGV